MGKREWRPVRYSTFVEDQSYNDTYLLATLDGSQLEIGKDPTSDGVTVSLPSMMRLCESVEVADPAPVPVEAIRNIMHTLLEVSDGTGGWDDILLADYEQALAWLAAMGQGGDHA